MNCIKKCLFILFGSISVVLAILGIFLPLLPTTPFLLLASFFYIRSSKRLYNWLITHKVFGCYIYCYLTYRAISKKTKIGSIILLWLSLSISMFLVPILYVRFILVAVGIGVTIHLLMLKTLGVDEIKGFSELV
ncbi:YbaN family protein [Herbivorax sp. ANBcel31]|uniref:YbaN family protein n=1 Tax=Herbivorax sp. ANBcel31 TaxID=3069754 RepID=UPI0027B67C5F|nr:YbaN family protein [Herbivorax sp. ANBcel31]MDQ2087735.1 YbaN family protein [Herbivorax sp. ANBcel31]